MQKALKKLTASIILGTAIIMSSVFLIGCNSNTLTATVISGSMMPTIQINDQVTMQRTRNVTHNDIIWYRQFDHNGMQFYAIKRAIAFGGDTVEFKRNSQHNLFHVYLNGEPLQQYYQTLGMTQLNFLSYQGFTQTNNSHFSLYIQQGFAFILGDNRGTQDGGSQDSRQDGPLCLNTYLIGRVTAIHPRNT